MPQGFFKIPLKAADFSSLITAGSPIVSIQWVRNAQHPVPEIIPRRCTFINNRRFLTLLLDFVEQHCDNVYKILIERGDHCSLYGDDWD